MDSRRNRAESRRVRLNGPRHVGKYFAKTPNSGPFVESRAMTDMKLSSDAVEWMYHTFYKNDPERIAHLELVRRQSGISVRVYDIREKFHMSRKDLAEFSGLTAETIEDVEETDYDGNWDEAIEKINTGFRSWFTNVVLPASRMTLVDYSVEVVGSSADTWVAG